LNKLIIKNKVPIRANNMTNEAKLNGLKTYVNERLDLHNDWYGKSNINKMFEELETELKEYRKLQSEVHTDIEKVWMYDGSFPLNQISMEERAKLIERVFYKIANQWID
jgi:hypothetical protein